MSRFTGRRVALVFFVGCMVYAGTVRGGAPPTQLPLRQAPSGARGGFSTETLALVREMQDVNRNILAAEGLLSTDTKVAALTGALKTASAAYEKKREEVVAASTETLQLRRQVQEVIGQVRDPSLTPKERREASRRNRDLTLRLRTLERQGREHPEVAALGVKVQELSKALRERLDELLKANPQTRALLDRREEIRRKINELQKRRTSQQPPPVRGRAVPTVPARK